MSVLLLLPLLLLLLLLPLPLLLLLLLLLLSRCRVPSIPLLSPTASDAFKRATAAPTHKHANLLLSRSLFAMFSYPPPLLPPPPPFPSCSYVARLEALELTFAAAEGAAASTAPRAACTLAQAEAMLEAVLKRLAALEGKLG